MWGELFVVDMRRVNQDLFLFLVRLGGAYDVLLVVRKKRVLKRYYKLFKGGGFEPTIIGRSIFYGFPAMVVVSCDGLREVRDCFKKVYSRLVEE